MGVLVSYAFLRDNFFDADAEETILSLKGAGVPTMLDSGAYTAHNTGTPIQLDEYLEFLKESGKKFTQYVQLDVVKQEQASRDNLQKMYDAGTTPMPVFTAHEDEKHFEWMLGFSDRICLGGSPQSNPKTWGIGKPRNLNDAVSAFEARVERFHRKSPQAKLHGLGYTRKKAWRNKFWSVDSARWSSAFRFGHMCVYDPVHCVITEHTGRWVIKKAFGENKSFDDFMVRSGIPVTDLQHETWRKGGLSAYTIGSACSMIEYSRAMRNRGITVFVVCGNYNMLAALAVAGHTKHSGVGFNWSGAKEVVGQLRAWRKEKAREKIAEWTVEGIANGFKDEERA